MPRPWHGAWLLLALAGAAAAQQQIGLSQPLAPQTVQRYAITLFPDGRNLPAEAGGVAAGRALYASQCAGCHGAEGIEGPAARACAGRPRRWSEQPHQIEASRTLFVQANQRAGGACGASRPALAPARNPHLCWLRQ